MTKFLTKLQWHPSLVIYIFMLCDIASVTLSLLFDDFEAEMNTQSPFMMDL